MGKTIETILLLWLLCSLSVLLHELGHALGFRLGGGKGRWRLCAGSGPRLLDTARFRLCLIPAGGFFVSEEEEEPRTRRGRILMLAGGPLISLLLAALFAVLRFAVFASADAGAEATVDPVYLSAFLLIFNFLQFLFTALPLRYRLVCRGLDSDGRQLLRLLRRERARRDADP